MYRLRGMARFSRLTPVLSINSRHSFLQAHRGEISPIRPQATSVSTIPGMERWRGKVALVTGASSGIGYAIAKQLTELGMNVVGCARNISKIESLASDLTSAPGKLLAVRCDVKKEEDILALFEAAKKTFGGVDVCVNNAGLAHDAPLLTGSTSDWRDMMEVNVLGVCVFNREFMKQLKERGVDDGHIILLNSVAGHRVGSKPDTHFYAATKHAITAITEGVRQELLQMNSNVKVTGISPGIVRTEFRGRLTKAEDIEESKKSYDLLMEVLEAEDIASTVVYAISTPPRMQIHDVLVRPREQTL